VRQVTPAAAHRPDGTLDGLSCNGGSFCVAVGKSYRVDPKNGHLIDPRVMGEVWNGRAWSQSPPVVPSGVSAGLTGISCPSPTALARHLGTATPPPPGSQSFWVATASGAHPALTWTVTSGSYRVVAMNTDAAAPVAFAGGLALTVPHSFGVGIGLLIGGIVVILTGIVLIVLGARARTQPQSQPPGMPG
jgi:hypothetical protein